MAMLPERRPPRECWVWTGRPTDRGYGRIRLSRVTTGVPALTKKAHVVAYCLDAGIGIDEIPEGKQVNHTCHNRPCVNPKHLYLGTHRENMRDRDIVGNTRRGEEVPTSKLEERQVLEMRSLYDASGISQRALADKYDVSKSAVGKILRREMWEHI